VDRPYPAGEIERIASQAAGRNLTVFFNRFVRGVETPPFERLLRAFGLVLRRKPEKGADDETPGRPLRSADFGWKTREEHGRPLVVEVYAGRAAYGAGICAGDELVAVSGVKADEEELKRIERDVPPGTRADVTVFRRKRLLTIPVVLGARSLFTYEIVPDERADPTAKRLRRGWLGRRLPP
jgi:predicted metalloprotease with PDZ domain